MLCKVCGAQIPDDAKECEFCGAKTDNTDNITDDATKVIPAEEIAGAVSGEATAEAEEIFDENEKKRREQMQKMMEDKKKQLSEIERRRSAKRQKQKRNRILLIALICALAVGAAGVGAYYITQNVTTGTVAQASPTPAVTRAAVTPPPSPAVTPAVSASPVPAEAAVSANTSGDSASQSWTATGGSSSSSQSTQRSSSSSQSSSSGGSSSGGGSSSSAKNSGIVSSRFESRLVTGGEVIYNNGTGRYLMTFTSDGVKYYANVSAGSTTEQVKNKPFTIDAEPTQESFNGNTVYEITDMTKYGGDYILANSGTTLLTQSDIKGLSKHDLALARNEIYARHGRKFQTEEYNKYFSAKSWYSVNQNYNYADDDSNLNEIERKNVEFILKAEKN